MSMSRQSSRRTPSQEAELISMVRWLARVCAPVLPRSTSVVTVGRAGAGRSDPVGAGQATRAHAADALLARFRLLEPRERELLFLWYGEDWPVTRIAAHLGISRVHCYRVRDRALHRLIEARQAEDGQAEEGPGAA